MFKIEEMRERLCLPAGKPPDHAPQPERQWRRFTHRQVFFLPFGDFIFCCFAYRPPLTESGCILRPKRSALHPLPKIRGCLPPSKTMCSKAREAPSLRRVIGLNSPLAAWRAPARNPPPTFRQGNLHPVYTERHSRHYSRMPLHLPLRRAQRGQGRGSKRAFLFPHPS